VAPHGALGLDLLMTCHPRRFRTCRNHRVSIRARTVATYGVGRADSYPWWQCHESQWFPGVSCYLSAVRSSSLLLRGALFKTGSRPFGMASGNSLRLWVISSWRFAWPLRGMRADAHRQVGTLSSCRSTYGAVLVLVGRPACKRCARQCREGRVADTEYGVGLKSRATPRFDLPSHAAALGARQIRASGSAKG